MPTSNIYEIESQMNSSDDLLTFQSQFGQKY